MIKLFAVAQPGPFELVRLGKTWHSELIKEYVDIKYRPYELTRIIIEEHWLTPMHVHGACETSMRFHVLLA